MSLARKVVTGRVIQAADRFRPGSTSKPSLARKTIKGDPRTSTYEGRQRIIDSFLIDPKIFEKSSQYNLPRVRRRAKSLDPVSRMDIQDKLMNILDREPGSRSGESPIDRLSRLRQSRQRKLNLLAAVS